MRFFPLAGTDFIPLILLSIATLVVATPASAAIPASERAVLEHIFTSTHGLSWTSNSGWCADACPASGNFEFNAVGTECVWYGVVCDFGESHVTALYLSTNKLGGTFPSPVALTHLYYIDIGYNNLTGNIPQLAGLTSLLTFKAANNQLIGTIPPLAEFVNLQYFEVSNNQLTGTIPALTALTNLQEFAAGSNHLSGTIPSFDGLVKLQMFSVLSNDLEGSIPALDDTDLYAIDVRFNRLSGTIPSLTSLANLESFFAGNNQLSGSIPDLTGLDNLVYFWVENNQLTGPLPTRPTAFLIGVLCPNPLDTTPSDNDPDWNAATGTAPLNWWQTPNVNNECDDLFTNGFGDYYSGWKASFN